MANKIERLIVCGDSFNARSFLPEFAGTHWSELLSKQLNLPLLNFASPGCSTKLVAMQVLEALKYPNSLVIFSPSVQIERFEILLDKTRTFETNISLQNFDNINDCYNNTDCFLKSINASFLEHEGNISARDARVLLDYIPLGFNSFIDKWAMSYALSQLVRFSFEFLFFEIIPHEMKGPLFNDLTELESLIGCERILYPEQHRFKDYWVERHLNPNFIDPGYHTTIESQVKIADTMYREMFNRKLING